MSLKNCRDCGRVFAFSGSHLCPNCLDTLDQAFYKVREFLYRYPDANVDIICEETEVSRKIVLQMLREGRLQIKAEASGLTCRGCKAPISGGVYCPRCLHDTERRLKDAANGPPAEERERMRRDAAGYHTTIKKTTREG